MNAWRSAPSVLSVCLLVLLACGIHRPTTGWNLASGPDEVRSSRAPDTWLERREIASFDGRSLAEAVEQLRPSWLRLGSAAHPNGGAPSLILYVNDVVSGDIAGLRTIPSATATEVRLLSQSEAWAQFGPTCRCPAGAILVRTRVRE